MAINEGVVGVAAAVGVVFAGVVGYKIIKKKNPDAFKNVTKCMTDIKDKTSKILDGAAESFREGYAQAS
jgi:hypothetical protein